MEVVWPVGRRRLVLWSMGIVFCLGELRQVRRLRLSLGIRNGVHSFPAILIFFFSSVGFTSRSWLGARKKK